MAQNIKVAVRVRPFIKREEDLRCECAVAMESASTTVLMQEPKTFTYDYSYWSHDHSQTFASQETVWTDIGEVILKNALDGFNGCLFAYGQTGTGKSYSVLGSDAEPGIIPRAVQRIFEEKTQLEQGEDVELRVSASYLEIYQEHIHDLLSVHVEDCPEKDIPDLTVMQHPKFGVYVPGLTTELCQTAKKVQELLNFGTKRRAIASTQMNSASSRSHAVFSVLVVRLDGKKPQVDGEKDTRHQLTAKINLIDLAGSERQSKTGAEGSTLREGCSINKSLSALGMVIKELSEAHSKLKEEHKIKDIGKSIPFRASKLTFLLKDSLAGNSRTYMIAAISPASDNIEETLSTLRFASSVKAIQTLSKQNKDKKDEIIDELRAELEMLRRGGVCEVSSEEIQERERMIDEMKKSYEKQIEDSQKFELLRKQALDHGGFSQEDMSRMLGVEESTPYLLNMADDPTTAGKLLYYLPRNKEIKIGLDEEADIRFSGVGITSLMCKLYHEDDHKLTICKCDPEARIMNDGSALGTGECRELKHGQCLFLGRSLAFKVCLPAVAREAFLAHELLLHGLEDEWAGMDSSPAMAKVEGFVNQACTEMPPEAATAFLRKVKEAAAAVDEANEITNLLRPNEGFSFDITITSGHSKQVVVHASQCTDQDGYKLLYLCSAEQFFVRLNTLRDFHCDYETRREVQVEAFHNPWQDTHMEEIHHIVTELRAKVEHLGGDFKTGPTIRLRSSSRRFSRGSTRDFVSLPKVTEEVLLEEETQPNRSDGEISAVTLGSKKTLIAPENEFGNERELDSTTDLVANIEAPRNAPGNNLEGQQTSTAPLHYIDLAGSLRSSPSNANDQVTLETRPNQQEAPMTPLGSRSRFTLASPSSSANGLSAVPVAAVPMPLVSRFSLASQRIPVSGTRKERSLVGSPGPSRHTRGRASVRSASSNALRSPSGSVSLRTDPLQGYNAVPQSASTSMIRSTSSGSYIAAPLQGSYVAQPLGGSYVAQPLGGSYVTQPLGGSMQVMPPVATIGLDTSLDGKPDVYVTGVHRNRDGIPDILQNSQVRMVSPSSLNLSPRPVSPLRTTYQNVGGYTTHG